LGYLWLGILTVGACQTQESPDRTLVLARDSADVHLIEYPAGSLANVPEWALASPIGSMGGDDDRIQVRGAVLVSDVELVVANGGDEELRSYRSTGQHVRTLARRGGGPGEFRSLAWVGIAPDSSVAAWDASANRITFFDDSGPARELSIEDTTAMRLIDGSRLVGMLADGSMVVQSGTSDRQYRDRAEGELRDSITLTYVDPSGHPTNVSIRTPGREKYLFRWNADVSEVWGSQPIIFGHDAFAVAAGDRLVVGANDGFELRAFDSTGRLRQIVRAEMAAQPATAADAEQVRAERREALRPGPIPEPMRSNILRFESAGIERVPFREVLPAFSELVGDQIGRVWIRMSALPRAQASRWLVVDSAGALRGSVELARGARVLAATARRLAVLSVDSLGTETIQVYELREGAAAPEAPPRTDSAPE
jgi:hypothetical protein